MPEHMKQPRQMALGRFGSPGVAKAVVSRQPGLILYNRTNIVVDGGYTKRVQF